MNAQIFISHINDEAALAEMLKQRLRQDFLGLVDVFVSSDLTSIEAGEDWLRAIRSAIEHATVEIILCSAASISRPWINFEAGAGWIRGISVVPACHSGMRPSDLPMPLSAMQAVELDQESGLKRLYGRVAKQIGALVVPEVNLNELAQAVREFEKSYTMRSRVPSDGQRRRIPEILSRGSTKHLHALADGAFSVADRRHRYMLELKRLLKAREIVPAKYLYWTELGSRRWLEICERDSYRFFRDSSDLLREKAHEIVACVIGATGTAELDLISLGSGDGSKDHLLLDSIIKSLSDDQRVYYYPIDISDSMIVQAVRTAVGSCVEKDKVSLKAIVADFTQMRELQKVFEERPNPNVFSILGNTIGNNDELAVIEALVDGMFPGDILLVEINVGKSGNVDGFVQDEVTMRADFVPLEVIGVQFEASMMEHHIVSDLSIVPNTETTVTQYRKATIDGVEVADIKLSLVHHYDLDQFRKVIERRLHVDTLLVEQRNEVALLVAQRRP